jgi:hypothetical protein
VPSAIFKPTKIKPLSESVGLAWPQMMTGGSDMHTKEAAAMTDIVLANRRDEHVKGFVVDRKEMTMLDR